MGMVDSFQDKDAECPKCHAKVAEWQTKDLERLGEDWERGDFGQYRKLERIPEKERKREEGDSPFPLSQTSKKDLSEAPPVFNGQIPVHITRGQCACRLVWHR